jgi:hypothetical protein
MSDTQNTFIRKVNTYMQLRVVGENTNNGLQGSHEPPNRQH